VAALSTAVRGEVDMTRQRIIAQCLLNSGMVESGRIEDADAAVLRHFEMEFPEGDFAAWNQDVSNGMAEIIIKKVGCATTIDVRQLIEDFVG
jgi:hypothetical protein